MFQNPNTNQIDWNETQIKKKLNQTKPKSKTNVGDSGDKSEKAKTIGDTTMIVQFPYGDDDDGDDDDDGYYYDYYDDDEDDYDYYDDQNISQIKPSKNCLIINHGKVWRVVTTYWGVIKNNNTGAYHVAILANTTMFCA